MRPEAAGEFIVAAFRAGENLIVAGDHNAGKTTFLRAVCFDAIAPHQRVVTVEASITELGLHQGDRLPNIVALYSRPPSAEGEGEVTVGDLIRRATRRLNPTRVIVGEILGDEVGPVLDVFSGSTRGSGCTIHARSARGAVRRFEQYGLAAHRRCRSRRSTRARRGRADHRPPRRRRVAVGPAAPLLHVDRRGHRTRGRAVSHDRAVGSRRRPATSSPDTPSRRRVASGSAVPGWDWRLSRLGARRRAERGAALMACSSACSADSPRSGPLPHHRVVAGSGSAASCHRPIGTVSLRPVVAALSACDARPRRHGLGRRRPGRRMRRLRRHAGHSPTSGRA